MQMWLTQYDRGELNAEEVAASAIAEYEAKIAALERKVGELTMEIDLLKKSPRSLPAGTSAASLIVSGPHRAQSEGDVK
jgi:transposase